MAGATAWPGPCAAVEGPEIRRAKSGLRATMVSSPIRGSGRSRKEKEGPEARSPF